MDVQMRHIIEAQQRLFGRVVRTPLVFSPRLSDHTGAEVWLKPEHFQLTGSFKPRGAYNKMAQLGEAARSRGVISASAGNHAQGVALAAKLLGLSALLITPVNTPETKLGGIRQYGAEVLQFGANYDEAEAEAYRLAGTSGRLFVHAFEDPDIVAGQGTVGLEMFQDQPGLNVLVVPAGGGGLIAGIGVAARAVSPEAAVVGVQSEASPAWYNAWQAGRVVDVEYQDTWAEGLLGAIGAANFVLAQRVVDRFALVSEDDIKEAMRWALDVHHWVLEGSGAVGLAYVLQHGRDEWAGQRVGVVLTGGNLDTRRLQEMLGR